MDTKLLARYIFHTGLVALSLSGHAEHTTTHINPPSANGGILDRTIEKEYEAQEFSSKRDVPCLEIDIPEEQFDCGPSRAILIDRIVVEGNTAVKDRELCALVEPYLHTELTMCAIQDLCRMIRAYYVEKGYFLARAYPPMQSIHENTLKIQVIEGTLGHIRIEGNEHYSEKFIRSYFKKFEGKPLNYDTFFRALMLVNENTDLNLGAIFEKGKAVGTADVILRVKDDRPLHLYLNTNSYGTGLNSLQRSGGRIDYGNLFFDGDTLSLAEVLGSPIESLNFTDVIYKFPLTKTGLTGELSYIYSRFKVNRDHSLNLKGKTSIGAIQLAYALQRTRRLSSDIYGSFECMDIKDFALDTVTSEDKLRVVRLGFDLNFADGIKGNNYFDFTVHQGIPKILGGSSAVSDDSSRKGAGGLFTYLYADYKRLQQIGCDFFFILNAAGQASFYKLPVPEQFYIGGIDTVRGFPLASALGDSGYYANGELRIPPPFKDSKIFKKPLKEIFQFLLFVDNGGVSLRSKETPLPKGYTTMTSWGTGARFYGPYHLDVSFDVGFPLTERHKSSNAICYWRVNWRI